VTGGAAGDANGNNPGVGHDVLAAGKVNVIGFDQIKERLGEKWPLVSERVHKYFAALLQRLCGPGDVVRQLNELSYVVVFADRDIADAQALCAQLAHRVARYCFGEGDNVAVRSVVGEVDRTVLLSDDGLADAVEMRLEASGVETVIPARTLNESLSQAQNAHRQLRLVYGEATGVNGGAGAIAVLPEELSFLYRPLWDPGKSAVYSYLCQPVIGGGPADSVLYEGGLCHAVDNELHQLELDLIVLRECNRRIAALRDEDKRLLISAPVHFNTLVTPRLWREYLTQYQYVPAESSRYLGFMIYGVGEGVPNVRLAQEIPKLSLRSKYVFCTVGDRPEMALNFANTSLQAVGMLVSASYSDRDLIAQVRQLGRKARRAGVGAFALGAPSRSFVLNAIESGVRAIEGPAVKNPLPEPKHGFARGVEDLYLRWLRQSREPTGVRRFLNAP
jgi:hypothetical protein